MKKHGLSIDAPRILVSILQTIHQIGYDPRKIVTELARIKSLRRTERQLKSNCKLLESHAAQFKEVLPICEQITRFGIGFPELAAFHGAVFKMMDAENLSYGQAPYALMDGIDTFEKLADMKKQLNDTIMKIQMMNEISASQNKSINTFMKLRLSGMTEDQILKMCRVIEANGHNLNSLQSIDKSTV